MIERALLLLACFLLSSFTDSYTWQATYPLEKRECRWQGMPCAPADLSVLVPGR